MQHAIEIRNLKYSIDDINILDDVSVLVEQNKRVGVIGPNGSGKTTLLKHIYRALPPEKKTVFVYGQEIEQIAFRDSAKKITVVKQENVSDFDYTVEEMVLLGRTPYRKYFESYTKEDHEKCLHALETIGMKDYMKRSFNKLSGGEKQRVLIARSLAQEADIFVLDEPTNHLDVYYQWAIMQMIKKLHTTVVGVFHELNLASYFCDYLYVLERGKIIAGGKPSEIITHDLLADVFKIDAEIIKTQDRPPRILIQGAVSTDK